MTTHTQESTDGGQQLLLGKMLLERGLITPDQLREALADRARSVSDGTAKPLGIILVAKGFLSDTQLVQLLAEQANRPTSGSDSIARFSGILPPPPSSSSPTATRLGKYELLNELGRGGMGVVYESLDTQLNRKVALKLMLTNPSADPKDVSLDEERFVQEAQLSAKLKHPNIVTVYEAGILEGRRFLAMELIEGLAYSDWRKDGAVSLKQQVEVLRDVAMAVHHAHEQGILHRDLKPRNVLVGGNGHAYVTDFGLAKSLGTAKAAQSLTGSGAVVGTPAYMSPEQAQGNDRVDWRTDIWSLGVMLYESLTGRTPFTGESPIEILMKVVKDPVPPPSTVVEGGAALALDRAVENVCMKALAKRDRDRYVTARAFAEDLTRWLNGEQIKVIAPKVTTRKSRKGVLIAAAAVALVATAVGGWLIMGRRSIEADLVQARRYMEMENYLDAAVAYSGVLKADPKNKEALDGARLARERDADKMRREEDRLRQQSESSKREEDEARKKAAALARKIDEAKTEEERRLIQKDKEELEEKARLAEEARRRADEELKKKLAVRPVNPVHPANDEWKDAISLLALAEFPRSVVWGTWNVQDNALVSDRESFARLEIPYSPPEEYNLKVVFSRESGCGEVGIILPVKGKSFSLDLGGWRNTSNGFQSFKGTRGPEHAAAVKSGRAIENRKTLTVEIQVRKDGVRAKLDGRALLPDKVALEDLSLDPCWSLRTQGVIGLGTNESRTVFRGLDLVEVNGKGRKTPLAATGAFQAVPVSVGGLKPGLVAIYHQGSNFEVPELSQIDSSPLFSWNEGPAWKNGPVDAFSVRWSGYLHIPKGGRYSFTLASDDGARLFIDDSQILSNWRVNSESARSNFLVFEEGYHKIDVEYFEDTYQASITLSWTDSAETAPVPVPTRLFYHDGAAFKAFTPQRYTELLAALPAHSNSVTGGAFSPDGKALATVSEDKRAKIWNVATRRELFSIPGHTQGVLCVSFSPEGALMATGGWDNRIRLWEPSSGAEVKVLDGHSGYVGTLAFSPDGKLLASGSADLTIRIWDPVAKKLLKTLSGHSASIESLCFSPDGKTLASGSVDRTIRLWDLAQGKEVRMMAGHADTVQSVSYNPDGTLLASASWDGLIKLWDPAAGREKASLAGHSSEVMSVAFSPDGKILASGGNDCMVRLWDPAAARELRVLPGHTARVMGVSFSKEGRMLVSVSFDTTARLWDLRAW